MTNRYPMPMPYGWFAVMLGDELAPGQALPLRLFAEDLVVFRTESGEVKILDAYCPHMGAHLGHGIHEHNGKGGKVQGDTVVCPFHGWKFNGDGVCEDVPYATNMPPKIQGKQCLKSWNVDEKNGVIWCWYHPEDKAPEYDVLDIPELATGDWGVAEVYRYKINTHSQELAENGSDPAHFRYVHGTAEIPTPLEVNFDGHRRDALLESRMHTPKGDIVGRIHLNNNGPGQTWTVFSGICDTVLQGLVTHIDEANIQVIFYFWQKKNAEGQVDDSGVARAIREDIKQQLREDTPIRENKKYWPMPILCDGDGPISKFRKWYAQFYVGYSEVKPGPDEIQVIRDIA